MRKHGFSAILVFLFFCATPDEAKVQELFRAMVSGDQEVPAVETEAMEHRLLPLFFNDRLLVGIRFNVAQFNQVTGVHIHEGAIGENGPIILNLRPDATCIDITRFITIYYATADHLRGKLAGLDLRDSSLLYADG